MTFFGVQTCGYGAESNYPRDTFQSILATDGVHSFALFYFNVMTWTTGRASSGDCQGLGGTPARSGFDAGDGRTLFLVPGSCSADIITINQRTNMNYDGKWMFRIDSGDIQTAGCGEKMRYVVNRIICLSRRNKS